MKKPQETERFEAYGEYAYAYQPKEEPPQYDAPAAEPRKPRRRSPIGVLIGVVTALAVAILLLQGTVFRLQTVYVVGNQTLSPQQVAAASGLVKGLNIFTVSEEAVRKNLSSNHHIVFEGMQKSYPSTIYLYISERISVAALQWLGIQYALDDQGMVMWENADLTLPESMPVVTGVQVTNVHVGQQIGLKDPGQLTAYRQIISELRLQLYMDQVSELNLADTDNLYLVTLEGVTVRLGDAEHMRAKIGALRTDIAYLNRLGKTTGILDVTTPEDAKFTPEN